MVKGNLIGISDSVEETRDVIVKNKNATLVAASWQSIARVGVSLKNRWLHSSSANAVRSCQSLVNEADDWANKWWNRR